MKGEKDKFRVIVRDFNTPLSTIDRTTTQVISEDIAKLNNTANQKDLIEIYRTPNNSRVHILFKCLPYLGHETNLSIFKRIGLIEYVVWLQWN